MSWKLALQDYIKNPEGHKNEVIIYDEEAVIIKDQFPKSAYHLLVLTRNPLVSRRHPTIGLTYDIKEELKPYVEIAQDYIYQEFTKKYKVLNSGCFFENDDELLDKDSFVENFIQVGIHSVPSMTNMHIHVMTKDFHSIRLKNKKHYNSFTTYFWIDWDSLPLNKIPDSKETEKKYLRDHDMISVYNGENFDNKFSKLKQHISDEFNYYFTSR
ncbi:hypothetical protein HG535_0A06400 [Zygotorulaspora mrakii]|uniref:Uncharacterized protein n=1 Tax=Zygotorulaspora mrakii TaxID=42260 RepID=A0A7H9AWC6_ZYGMR|nr:uncharacterized protein HG535_0A06400 [Zygotorulaspora mrakii]QLG70698.1 hypothetical protein HG535_0A06400 [Zygotorulaspora mrakii]